MAHYVTEKVRGVCTFDEAYFPTYEHNCKNGIVIFLAYVLSAHR